MATYAAIDARATDAASSPAPIQERAPITVASPALAVTKSPRVRSREGGAADRRLRGREPRIPSLEPFARSRGDAQDLDLRVHCARVGDGLVHVEVDVRQQVQLVYDQQSRRAEHVRILERLVVAFRHGEHHDLGPLAQIEQRRAHEVADVLDHHQ
jgi:hypothetical protein